MWRIECLNTRFPLPTLLYAGYIIKLIIHLLIIPGKLALYKQVHSFNKKSFCPNTDTSPTVVATNNCLPSPSHSNAETQKKEDIIHKTFTNTIESLYSILWLYLHFIYIARWHQVPGFVYGSLFLAYSKKGREDLVVRHTAQFVLYSMLFAQCQCHTSYYFSYTLLLL